MDGDDDVAVVGSETQLVIQFGTDFLLAAVALLGGDCDGKTLGFGQGLADVDLIRQPLDVTDDDVQFHVCSPFHCEKNRQYSDGKIVVVAARLPSSSAA